MYCCVMVLNLFISLVKAADEIKFTSRQVEDARAMLDRGANLFQVTTVLKTGKSNAAIVEAIEAAINLGMDKNDPMIEAARARLAALSANMERTQDVRLCFFLCFCICCCCVCLSSLRFSLFSVV